MWDDFPDVWERPLDRPVSLTSALTPSPKKVFDVTRERSTMNLPLLISLLKTFTSVLFMEVGKCVRVCMCVCVCCLMRVCVRERGRERRVLKNQTDARLEGEIKNHKRQEQRDKK